MKGNLFSWMMYDAANSFLNVSLGSLYLAQWIVIDNKYDDIWYGGLFSLATIFVLITSPFWGAWSDKIKKRLPFIKFITLIIILLDLLLTLIANSKLPIFHKVTTVLIFFVLIQYFYQISLIFYNALLNILSSKKNRGTVSGLGEVFNNLGWLLAAMIFLPFANGKITIFGPAGRNQVFLPAFILFSLFSLPMVIFFREPVQKINKDKSNPKEIYAKTISCFKKLFLKNKNVGIFLLGFMLVSDVILTVQLYFAIILEAIYKLGDSKKVMISVLMMLFSIMASYVWGKIVDKTGDKNAILFCCFGLITILTIAFLSSAPALLYFIAPLMGIGWAGYYVATRSLMLKISPPTELGEYFGLYSTFQRLASVIGPLLWGITTLSFKSFGILKYRAAGIVLIITMIIGTYILTKVKTTKSYY